MNTGKIKIVLVGNNKTFRENINVFFETELEFEIVGQTDNGKQFLDSKIGYRADIILIDLDMPLEEGIDTAKQWIWQFPTSKIIGVTIYKNITNLQLLIESGFKGCISKSDFKSQIKDTIKLVIAGKYYFNINYIKFG